MLELFPARGVFKEVSWQHVPRAISVLLRGLQSSASKFHMMSAIVNCGFDVLYLDFDLVFFRDPLVPILKAAEKAELLLSRDLGGECINIGATRSSSRWFSSWSGGLHEVSPHDGTIPAGVEGSCRCCEVISRGSHHLVVAPPLRVLPEGVRHSGKEERFSLGRSETWMR